MRPTATTRTAGLLMAVWVGMAAAADPPTRGEIAKATKPAVAVVRADTYTATATCVSPKGYYLAPAAGAPGPGGGVTVVAQAGEKDEKSLAGTVVEVDAAAGLALIKVDSPTPLAAVEFGDESKLTETDELIAFAAPQPTYRVPTPGTKPDAALTPVVVNKVNVSTLSKKQGALAAVVVTPRPDGLPGGPVLDLTGKAVGVLGGKVADFTTAAVIPAGVVRAFLTRPRLTFDTPAVEPARRHDPVKVGVTAFALPELPADEAVELLVRSGGRERRVPMTRTKTGYEASVAPFEKADRVPVPVELRFPDGTVRGEVPDRPFTVGGKAYTLGRVSGVRFGKAGGVTLPDGTAADGEVKGLDELPVSVGGQTLTLPTAAARELTVRTVVERPGEFRLTAVVSRSGKEVGRAEAVRFLKGSEPHGIDGLALGLFVKPPEADKPTTYGVIVGTDGTGRLAGKTVRFEGAGVKPTASALPGRRYVSVEMQEPPPKPGEPFRPPARTVLTLTPPGTDPIQVKEYPKAKGDGGLGSPEFAGVGLFTAHMIFPVDTAKFVVWELEADAKGVKALAVDVIASEENATGRVLMSVRFNSKYK